MKHTANLPVPDPNAQDYSDRLLQLVIETIDMHDGWLSFAEFMQLALYQPGLGYYSNGLPKIGAAGDFITAPEISPLFSQAFARHIADALQQIPQGDCLEFGAGSGQMAADILLYLQQIQCLPKHYFIVEASAHLRLIQQNKIKDIFGEDQSLVIWLDYLPDNFEGVIIANEVCDAMPVHRVQLEQDQLLEIGVGHQKGLLEWRTTRLSNPALKARCEQILPQLTHLPYQTEIALQASAWLATLSQMLSKGAIYLVDYGYEAKAYFHSSKHQGFLRCHYRHQVHENPLVLVGLQDITAHVDFTALAETASQNGLHVEGFQRQSDFLLAGDILDLAQKQQIHDFAQIQQAAALKRLLLPDLMGEQFKVLSLAKELELPRSKSADLRYCL